MATTAPSFHPSSSTRACPLTLTLRCSPSARLEHDLDVAEPLARTWPGAAGSPRGSSRRPSGRRSSRLDGIRPDRLDVVGESVQPAGGRVEDGDPALGVAGDDALVEGVEQHLEELLLLAERVGRPRGPR